jgi:hypothetical protein
MVISLEEEGVDAQGALGVVTRGILGLTCEMPWGLTH